MKGNVWTPELPNLDNVVGLAAAGQQDSQLFSFPDVSSRLHASEGSIYSFPTEYWENPKKMHKRQLQNFDEEQKRSINSVCTDLFYFACKCFVFFFLCECFILVMNAGRRGLLWVFTWCCGTLETQMTRVEAEFTDQWGEVIAAILKIAQRSVTGYGSAWRPWLSSADW